MWGQFPTITHPHERAYVRAYWRSLLGWGAPPLPPPTLERARYLRILARHEVLRYCESAKTGKIILFKHQNSE